MRRSLEISRDDLTTGTSRAREIVFDTLEASLLGVRWLVAVSGRVVLWLPLSLLALPLLVLRRLSAPILRRLRRSSSVRFWASDLPGAMARLRFLGFEPTLGELLDDLQIVTRKVPRLHSNACGDFILTDAASWQAMRGSPELVAFSMHLDSLTLITALKLRIRIAELPPEMAIFHIEHGSGWTPEQHVDMYRRINRAGIRVLSHGSYLRYADNLLSGPSYFLARKDWGLANFDVPDQVVTPRRSPPGTADVAETQSRSQSVLT